MNGPLTRINSREQTHRMEFVDKEAVRDCSYESTGSVKESPERRVSNSIDLKFVMGYYSRNISINLIKMDPHVKRRSFLLL